MQAIVKFVVLLIAALWPSMLWADPAVTISWPGSYGRGSLKLTLIANDGTGPTTYTKTVPYGEFSTPASLAGALGAHISMSPDWPVWAKGYPDGTVLMKARGTGITVSSISVCAIASGATDCGSTPSGANLGSNASNVVPSGVSLDGALYGYSITDTSGNSGYDAAGNITAYEDTVNQRWTLGYDALNRLASASQYVFTSTFPTPRYPGGGSEQHLCWVYDSFGNRKRQAASDAQFSDLTGCTPPTSDSVTLDQQYASGTNQLTSAPGLSGITYDEAGNLKQDGKFQYLYNEDGQLCAVMLNATAPYGAIGYLYNAEGRRVAKGTLSSFTCDFSSNGFTMTNEYIPGPDGNTLTEVAWKGSTATPLRTYANAGGQLAATLDTNGTHYQLSDWLGTRRVQQQEGTTQHEVTCGNLPFGDGQTCADAVPQHFTGKERDQESSDANGKNGLDYFGARYYASSIGRFVSPDPGWFLEADSTNPQTWNQYSYVRNNPLGFIDPTGMDECRDANDQIIPDDQGGDNDSNCKKAGGTWIVKQDPTNVVNVDSDSPDSGQMVTSYYNGYIPSQQQQGLAQNNICFVPTAPSGVSVNTNIKFLKVFHLFGVVNIPVFYEMVRNKGPMDYKQQAQNVSDGQSIGSPYADFGNFNYGAVGAAMGIPKSILLRGAGYAQGQAGTSSPEWGNWKGGPPYGDDPNDQARITAGYNYYQAGCYKHS